MKAVYESIGKSYDATRRADPRVRDGLLRHLQLRPADRLLDLGCGSGNYTIALHQAGADIEGLDVSEEMLSKARAKAPQVKWTLSDAHTLPFSAEFFDRVVCILATHHMKDLGGVFHELFRVLKKGGRFVLFTTSPEQMATWWLNHYVPGVVQLTAGQMSSFESLRTRLEKAGFTAVDRERYWVDEHTVDGFIQGGPWRPERFLDPVVQAGISSFALYKDREALAAGEARLRADVASGEVVRVIGSFQPAYLKEGDYFFLQAVKP